MPKKIEVSIKRKALRALTYGLYIASVKSESTYFAAIVRWLSQVSFKPAQIMIALERDGRYYSAAKKEGSFAVNIPGTAQKKLAASLLKGCHVDGKAINGFPFFEGKSGAPYFEECAYYLECEVRHIFAGTDHDIIVAEVIDAKEGNAKIPLTLKDTGWKYGG